MSWTDGVVTTNGGARGACSLSVGLANGQFYMLQSNVPFGCVCGPFEAGISGWAADKSNPVSEAPDRLETAAAPMTAGAGSDLSADASWPMFRHDGRRSSCTSNTVPDALAIRWSRKVAVGKWPDTILRRDWELRVPSGHFLSGPTLAEGRVFVSLTEAGAAMALDVKDGRVLWSFPTGGRLDTPPSIVNGLALAGSHDGSVYALDAATGKQQWRFQAAPIERRLLAYGQIESSWPVIGGVLLEQGTAYVIAGRTTEIDSGLFVHAIDPKTGQLLWSRRRPLPPGDKSPSWNIFRGWADLLACDGRAIAIAGCPRGRFDPKTGDVPREPGLPKYTAPVAVGLNYVSRNLYGNGPGEYPPSPVVFNDEFVCRPFIRFEGDKPRVRASGLVARLHGAKPDEKIWQAVFPPGVVVESLVMAGDRILAAMAITTDGKRSGELQLFSAKDGAKVGSLPLPAAPVFEGLAVAREGRVFASLEDGTIVCLAAP
jgi:outer membrane protein assembly factor BamB